MRKFAPYFLLVPPVVLLLYLPSAIRRDAVFGMTPANLILSIFIWLSLFLAVSCFNRGSRLTRLFVVATAILAVIRIVYRFQIGEVDLVYFLIWLFLDCAFFFFFFIFASSNKSQKPNA